MPEPRELVINTGPLIALIAATRSLDLLEELFDRVLLPREVYEEICTANGSGFGADVVQ